METQTATKQQSSVEPEVRTVYVDRPVTVEKVVERIIEVPIVNQSDTEIVVTLNKTIRELQTKLQEKAKEAKEAKEPEVRTVYVDRPVTVEKIV